jgi:hypothetical protein
MGPHSTNAVLDDIATVVQLGTTILVGFLVYMVIKWVRRHVAQRRDREAEAREVTARATERALTAEGAAAAATAEAATTTTMCDAVYVQLRGLSRTVQCITREIHRDALDYGVAMTATNLGHYAGTCLRRANTAMGK